MAKKISVRASYLGNKGTHLDRQDNLNDPGPAPGVVQVRRPYQPFGNINYYESGANSFLNQFQFGAVRRFTAGFSVDFEYMLTRELTEQPFGISPPTNPFYARLDWGNADFVRTHYGIVNYTYDLPFGRGRAYLNQNRLTDYTVGGWTLGTIVVIQSGNPFQQNQRGGGFGGGGGGFGGGRGF